jgi:hypothetical protein
MIGHFLLELEGKNVVIEIKQIKMVADAERLPEA